MTLLLEYITKHAYVVHIREPQGINEEVIEKLSSIPRLSQILNHLTSKQENTIVKN